MYSKAEVLMMDGLQASTWLAQGSISSTLSLALFCLSQSDLFVIPWSAFLPRVFAFALLSAWNALPPDSLVAGSSPWGLCSSHLLMQSLFSYILFEIALSPPPLTSLLSASFFFLVFITIWLFSLHYSLTMRTRMSLVYFVHSYPHYLK